MPDPEISDGVCELASIAAAKFDALGRKLRRPSQPLSGPSATTSGRSGR